MEKKKNFYEVVEELYEQDRRYKPDSYEFLMQALHFTQKKLKRTTHVSGKELLEGVREFGVDQFGPMIQTVFKYWGITKTEDFGNIVFNLLEKKVLSKTDEDSLNDFKDVYDFKTAFGNVLRESVLKQLEK